MLTQERLKELFEYRPETGEFIRLVSIGNQKAGSTAGCLRKTGYIEIRVDKVGYKAHRLAFLYMEGYIPEVIDHVNRIRSDNRWANLRESNNQENSRNRTARSKSGYLGIFWHKQKQKWEVRVVDSYKKLVHGGYFDFLDLELAVQRANELRLELHGPNAVIETFDHIKPLPTLEELNK
ncbi:putative homing endonuclease [Salmonella phage oldekolle]|uniref:Putative homing endonuclease n=1 Tax=Salmonella phage oldekolle TaxID=2713308 RepID=A0A6G8RD82_9CAUD|nr:putative homing endonuclease [Salmonella phage oldekolle]QIN99385.1 putative homing endonuclease [Salmonella phage oldekolle]